jgi:hypothetical protein
MPLSGSTAIRYRLGLLGAIREIHAPEATCEREGEELKRAKMLKQTSLGSVFFYVKKLLQYCRWMVFRCTYLRSLVSTGNTVQACIGRLFHRPVGHHLYFIYFGTPGPLHAIAREYGLSRCTAFRV